ncbi:hypothetical protein BHM03_00059846, partial [Ensete ventricosum]
KIQIRTRISCEPVPTRHPRKWDTSDDTSSIRQVSDDSRTQFYNTEAAPPNSPPPSLPHSRRRCPRRGLRRLPRPLRRPSHAPLRRTIAHLRCPLPGTASTVGSSTGSLVIPVVTFCVLLLHSLCNTAS